MRVAFLETLDAISPLLAEPALAHLWDGPSALRLWSVRGLAGHLLRGTTSVEAYLDRGVPGPADGAPVSAAAYVTQVTADGDLTGDFHRAIRTRGEEAAPDGPAGLAAAWAAAHGRLADRLAVEPADRLVRVYGDIVLRLDDYLATRLVELCLHADDLAASLDRPVPLLPSAATAVAVDVLVDVARLRHGDGAVLRALARRERDAPGALRVL